MSGRSLRTRRPSEKLAQQTKSAAAGILGEEDDDEDERHRYDDGDDGSSVDGSEYAGEEEDDNPSPTKKRRTATRPSSIGASASGPVSSRMSASGSGDVGLLAPDYTLNPAGPASSAEIDFKCPNCNKIYRGKHARSIWRRHLQDKHGIPLSMQPRRTRWDNDANRPRDAEERRARTLDSKRRWARKARAGGKGKRRGSDSEDDDDDDEDYDRGSSLAAGDGHHQHNHDDDDEDLDLQDGVPEPSVDTKPKRGSATRGRGGRGTGRGRGRPKGSTKAAVAARKQAEALQQQQQQQQQHSQYPGAPDDDWEDTRFDEDDSREYDDWTAQPVYPQPVRSPYRSSPIQGLPPRSRGVLYPPGNYDHARGSALRATSSLEPEYEPAYAAHRDFRNLPPLPPGPPYHEQPHLYPGAPPPHAGPSTVPYNYYDSHDAYGNGSSSSGRYSAPPPSEHAYNLPAPPAAMASLATVDGRAALAINPSPGAGSSSQQAYYSPRANRTPQPLASPVRLAHQHHHHQQQQQQGVYHQTESKEDAAVVLLALKQASSAPPSPAGPAHPANQYATGGALGMTAPRARTFSNPIVADEDTSFESPSQPQQQQAYRGADTSFSSFDGPSSDDDPRSAKGLVVSAAAGIDGPGGRASLARARAVAVPLSRGGSADSSTLAKRSHSPGGAREAAVAIESPKRQQQLQQQQQRTTAAAGSLLRSTGPYNKYTSLVATPTPGMRRAMESSPAARAGGSGHLQDLDGDLDDLDDLDSYPSTARHPMSYSSTRDEKRPSSTTTSAPSNGGPRSHALSNVPSSSSVGLSSELGGFGLHSSSGGSNDELSSSTGGGGGPGTAMRSRNERSSFSQSSRPPASSSSFLATPAPSDARMSHLDTLTRSSGSAVFGGGGANSNAYGSSAAHDHYYTHLASSNLPPHPFANDFPSSGGPGGANAGPVSSPPVPSASATIGGSSKANQGQNAEKAAPSAPSAAAANLFSSPAHPSVSRMLGLTAQPGPGVWVGDTPGRETDDDDDNNNHRNDEHRQGLEQQGRPDQHGGEDWSDWNDRDGSPEGKMASQVRSQHVATQQHHDQRAHAQDQRDGDEH